MSDERGYEAFKKYILKHNKKTARVSSPGTPEETIKFKSEDGMFNHVTRFHFNEDNIDLLEMIPEYREFASNRNFISIIKKSLGF